MVADDDPDRAWTASRRFGLGAARADPIAGAVVRPRHRDVAGAGLSDARAFQCALRPGAWDSAGETQVGVNAAGYIGAAISVLAGVLGLIWPQKVSAIIGLSLPGKLGISEFRATYGGLFIGAGLATLLIGTHQAALVLGAAWGGAFVARAVSLIIDKSRSRENLAGLVIEAAVATLLVLS
ncbi:MAG: DUF4345 domain-containing protein [Mycobacteriaceae bacterium]|nr:DUF4345 domain-containing protein [Mycobacterium sp.]NBP85310.1 DUF4345 domain-containing protein [Mycobacteriaceae bacterium]NBQ44190.1 DUF4345 domain-containing protein [Mycobacteriaceae bacterium]